MNRYTIEAASEDRYAPSRDDSWAGFNNGATGEAEQSSGGSASEIRVERPSSTVLIGIPAYNEAKSIAGVVADAMAHADEVLVVDDGSDDATSERAREAGATVITHETNMGYGAALGTIFRHAYTTDVDHLVTVDGDGQHDPKDISKLIGTQRSSGADIVIGSRFVDGVGADIPVYRRVGLAVVNTLTNLGLWLRYSSSGVSDTQSGFRAYGRGAIETMVMADEIGTGMGASLDILFHAAREGDEIEEVSTTIRYDIDDPSTQSPVAHGLGLLVAIFFEVVPRRARRVGAGVSLTVVLLSMLVVLYGVFGAAVAGAFGAFLFGAGAAIRAAFPRASRSIFGLANR